MLYDIVLLLLSLGMILAAAGMFTNAVEWVGKILGLTESSVGSILAAVGTAMPETIIPIIAILFGIGESAHEIGIGAILGAPFMLSTLAFTLAGLSVFFFRKRRLESYPMLLPDSGVMKRDLGFFLIVYTLAIVAAFFPAWLKTAAVIFLLLAYVYFVYRTIRCPGGSCEGLELEPLYFSRRRREPPRVLVYIQVLVSLGIIVAGARVFVDAVSHLAGQAGIPALIFSMLIAPVATELPEKFNSVLWIRQGKDSFALGNITGAMVFQSSVVPAVGIALTPWKLTDAAVLSAVLALVSALLIFLSVRSRGKLHLGMAMFTGLFYVAFVYATLSGMVV